MKALILQKPGTFWIHTCHQYIRLIDPKRNGVEVRIDKLETGMVMKTQMLMAKTLCVKSQLEARRPIGVWFDWDTARAAARDRAAWREICDPMCLLAG